MATALAWALGVLVAVLALPTTVLALEVLCGAWARRRDAALPASPAAGRTAVLVPAHDEALGLGDTLRALQRELRHGDRIVVVADNCADDTARVAREAGCEAVERHDPDRRGKGYALDFGMTHLSADPPDIVMIVDADCLVQPTSVARLREAVCSRGLPAQALYLMQAPPEAGIGTRIAAFAWRVKNHLRALGLRALGLPCPLQGSGMAFPYATLAGIPLASGNLVEDLALGLDLVERGHPPQFVPAAQVTSQFPLNTEGARSQRTRWEHGHLHTVLTRAPALLGRSLRQRSLPLLGMALDLCVPPLALLVMLCALAVALTSGASLVLGTPAGLAAAAFAVLALLAATVMLAWACVGRDVVSARDLLWVPLYALRKIPMYLRFLVRRQDRWVRSRRDRP